jgi:hypothetical protein
VHDLRHSHASQLIAEGCQQNLRRDHDDRIVARRQRQSRPQHHGDDRPHHDGRASDRRSGEHATKPYGGHEAGPLRPVEERGRGQSDQPQRPELEQHLQQQGAQHRGDDDVAQLSRLDDRPIGRGD